MNTFAVFLLLSPDNELALGSIRATREDAEADLKKEFPKGHIIWEGYRVVEATLTVKI